VGLPKAKGQRRSACDGVLKGLVTNDYHGPGTGTLCNRYRQVTIADRLGYPDNRDSVVVDSTVALFSECADGLSCGAQVADFCTPPVGAGADGAWTRAAALALPASLGTLAPTDLTARRRARPAPPSTRLARARVG
jgi:hypothetical protein